MNGMIKRYLELYENMATSKLPEKMHIFGEAEKWAFAEMVTTAPHKAQIWLNKLEPSCWNNYLSREEAERIASRLENQDGRMGANWSYDIFANVVKQFGGVMEDKPYYNSCALWVTANMLYSDHLESVKEFISKEHMPKFFYLLAVEKLKDVDRPRFVREYFGL